MELDFTWMTSIKDEKAKRDFNPALAKNRPSEQASEPRKADTEYKLPSVQQKPTQSRVEPVAGLKRLQEKEEAIKRDHEQSVQVYREYQKNIKLTITTYYLKHLEQDLTYGQLTFGTCSTSQLI